MRLFALCLLLYGPAAAEETLLHEERSWLGTIEVTATSRMPADGKGEEVHTERIEFRLVSMPPRVTIARPRLPMTMREGKGSWSLVADTREGEGRKQIVTKGKGRGRLWPRVQGYVEPETGRYRLIARATPAALVAKATLSGFHEGRFTTWRTTVDRAPFLGSFDVKGRATEDGRVLEGEKTFVDRRARLTRDVTIRWRLERVDPVIRGRVVDPRGQPVAGLDVIARKYNPDRRPLVRSAKTDEDGCFSIPVFFSPWTVEVRGAVRDGVVYEGRLEALRLRPDRVTTLDIELSAYRHAALPRPRLVKGHFQGDLRAYFEWIRARYPERRLEAAKIAD